MAYRPRHTRRNPHVIFVASADLIGHRCLSIREPKSALCQRFLNDLYDSQERQNGTRFQQVKACAVI